MEIINFKERAMTNFLVRTFIKDSENIENPSVRTAYGKLSGKVGIICNLFLCAGKFIAGILSGSVSITADAANNLSDASSSVISLIGFKLSEKSADREHPYGHGRYEYLAGFVVAALIVAIGFGLLRDGIERIISPAEVEFGILPAAVLGASILVKFWMMLFNRKLERKIHSEALKATFADSRNDVITTSAVLAAFLISHYFGIKLDGIMAAAVAVFILYSGIGLIKEAMDPLLGKAPDEEQAERIREKILSYKGVLGTHDLMIHDYGPGRQFASVHVEVPADMPLVKCHEIIDKIERDFLQEGLNMLVHPDPIASSGSLEGKINAELCDITKKIDERITIHDLRTVHCSDETKVIFDCVLPRDSGLSEQEIREEISRFIAVKFPDCRCIISFDSGFASIPKSKEQQ